MTDANNTERYLHCNNYYNVINIYGKLFCLNNNTENFIPGTKFEEIETVSFFEYEIKGALFKGVIACEMKLKSVISHFFCFKYNVNNNYLDYLNFSNDPSLQNEITGFITEVNALISKYCKFNNDNAIKHYHKIHGSIPLWVLINFLEFGKVEKLYKIMKQLDQQLIANEINNILYKEFGVYTLLSPKDLIAYISSIRELRNIIAHNGKLIGFKARTSVTYSIDLHSIFNIQANAQRQDVYNIFVILIPFLSYRQYSVLYNSILETSKHVNGLLYRIKINDVLNSIGFPNDFYNNKKIDLDNLTYSFKPLYIK